MADDNEWDKFLNDLEGALDGVSKPKKKTSRKEKAAMLMMADVMRREFMSPEDPDFAEKLSPYMAGEIDPSVARHLELDLPQDVGLNLRGAYNPHDDPIQKEFSVGGKPMSLEFEPGTVNAIHTRNNPRTWAHEFRHRNYPELSEDQNRTVDLVAAQSEIDRDDAIRLYANSIRKRVPSDSLDSVAKKFRNLNNPYLGGEAAKVIEAETGRDAVDVADESVTAEFLRDAKDLDKWNKGVKERNQARRDGEPETIADMIRRLWGDE